MFDRIDYGALKEAGLSSWLFQIVLHTIQGCRPAVGRPTYVPCWDLIWYIEIVQYELSEGTENLGR